MIRKFIRNQTSKVIDEKIDELEVIISEMIDKKLYEKMKATKELEKIAKEMAKKFTHESEF